MKNKNETVALRSNQRHFFAFDEETESKTKNNQTDFFFNLKAEFKNK